MKKILLTIIAVVAFAITSGGVTMQQMRFHCENDTIRINELLMKGFTCKTRNANALVSLYARELLGTPYVGHTLEGDSEKLTINIDELDCTTFVETLYALTRTTLDGRYSWRDYAANLESLRYRGGIMTDYSSRLHYISEWIVDNHSRGNLVEVTGDLPHCQYQIKSINFMSQHKDSYRSLKDDKEMLDKIIKVENKLRKHRMPELRKSWLGDKQVMASLQDGDFVGLVTKIEGLDISHLGIIIKDENGYPHLLDASMSGGKVMLEDKPLKQYLSGSRSTVTGIRVFRIKND